MSTCYRILGTLCLAFLLATPVQADTAVYLDRDPTPAFTAMAAAGSAYLNDSSQCPGVLSATTLFDNLDAYTVIDLRSPTAYEMGHIPGAYPSSFATLMDDLATFIPSDNPYVLVGYTGQAAGFAKIAMELMGYDNVSTLAWGMSSWNPALDTWSVHCNDNLPIAETTDQNPNLTVHDFPELPGEAATIVAERIELLLDSGYRGLSYAAIQDNLDEYFIINYFSQSDYLGFGTSGVPGHIPGAFQFTPYASLAIDQMLNTIPLNMPVVVYGWTGQHSGQVAAYLNLLGYDAYNLNFGANDLFYSQLTAHRWSPASANNFPLEVGSISEVPLVDTAPFALLKNHPNPFNPVTTISYRLNEPARVSLRIFDLAGRQVRALVRDADQVADTYAFTWRGLSDAGQPVPSGTYFYRLDSGKYSQSRRLMLLK